MFLFLVLIAFHTHWELPLQTTIVRSVFWERLLIFVQVVDVTHQGSVQHAKVAWIPPTKGEGRGTNDGHQAASRFQVISVCKKYPPVTRNALTLGEVC